MEPWLNNYCVNDSDVLILIIHHANNYYVAKFMDPTQLHSLMRKFSKEISVTLLEHSTHYQLDIAEEISAAGEQVL